MQMMLLKGKVRSRQLLYEDTERFLLLLLSYISMCVFNLVLCYYIPSTVLSIFWEFWFNIYSILGSEH